MANFSCDVATLVALSKCFMDPCLSDDDREAIEIYLRVQNLAAIGGADYTSDLNALLTDSKQYQTLSRIHRSAIALYIDMQNAVDNGASIGQDVNALKAAAKCYECIGDELKKQVLAYLKCQINALGKPD